MSRNGATAPPRKKVAIHAGRHKTGTSYLQTVFGLNEAKLLAECRVLYPQCGRDPHYQYHHNLIKALGNQGAAEAELVNRFKQEVEASGAQRVLLSSEYLSRSTITAEFLDTFLNNLSEYDVEVLFYLRRPSDFLCSRYAQQIRMGLLSHPKSIMDVNAELDSISFLERYIRAFGESAIHVRSYDAARQSGGLLEDFLSWLNPGGSITLTLPDNHINQRHSWRYLALLRYANRYHISRKLVTSRPFVYASNLALLRFPQFFDGNRPITASEAESLDARYMPSLELALEKYGKRTTLSAETAP